jgi:hypothetical protein
MLPLPNAAVWFVVAPGWIAALPGLASAGRMALSSQQCGKG